MRFQDECLFGVNVGYPYAEYHNILAKKSLDKKHHNRRTLFQA